VYGVAVHDADAYERRRSWRWRARRRRVRRRRARRWRAHPWRERPDVYDVSSEYNVHSSVYNVYSW